MRGEIIQENPEYLTRQIVTYIGNKRALLPQIETAVENILPRLGKKKITAADVFSGSGIVARFLKRYCRILIANDLEPYSEQLNLCYLSNKDSIDMFKLKELHKEIKFRLETGPLKDGIISSLYAPKNDSDIKPGERVFYTRRNAEYLDTARNYIEELPDPVKPFFLAPLLSEASVHANTSGVFKGFYKNSKTGIGQFGGNNRDAITRITGHIELPFPVFSNFEGEFKVFKQDANSLAEDITEIDLAYLDPPYNQHPYGSNYFMLNLITEYKNPENISKISGIPTDWKRSAFNKKAMAFSALEDLINRLPAKFILLSFNSEGFINRNEVLNLLEKLGKTQVQEIKYNTFRGSRNLFERNIYVKEYLFTLEKR